MRGLGIRARELFLLAAGDVTAFFLALWLTLLVRYGAFPDEKLWALHLPPFALLSVVWVCVFFLTGLYDNHTMFLRRRLAALIAVAQVINVTAAAAFFFFVPFFNIAPKTNLVIYLFISSFLILLWRLVLFNQVAPRRRNNALLIAEGEEAETLVREVNENPRYPFKFVRFVDYQLLATTPDADKKALALVSRERITLIIADLRNEHVRALLPSLFSAVFLEAKLSLVDFATVYEEIFDRIPLSCLRYDWLLEHMATPRRRSFDLVKRGMDIVLALVLGAGFAVVLPLVALAMRIEGKGPLFISQRRVGRYNTRMTVYKLRTMRESDAGAWAGEARNEVTRVGKFLRASGIDELPQMWNVLKGELSLVGPRSDIEDLGVRLMQEIPYYLVRYRITPGITGWAQTHQHYAPGNISPQSIEESRVRLAYDLYYVKNRSLLLDALIILRTLKTLLGRFGTTLRMR